MMNCFFATDLHGNLSRYRKFFKQIKADKPDAVFLGGDLLPSGLYDLTQRNKPLKNFTRDFLLPEFSLLKAQLGKKYPRVFLILGNDDWRSEESDFIRSESQGVWEYMHNKKVKFGKYYVYGYSCVPPTPFLLKDWEQYDISRFTDPGCVSPEEGWRSVQIPENQIKYSTIQKDLQILTANDNLSKSIFLFHAPPYKTKLDRAALDNKMIDHAPLDVHVGSIAIKRLIEKKQPFITLHGHIHESASITGSWKQKIGNTYAFSAAHRGPELSLVRFNPDKPNTSWRELI